MKARVPTLSKNQLKKVNAEIDKMIKHKHEQSIRRYMKIMCHVLNEHYGFGKHRLSKVISEIGKLSAESDTDEIFWEHIDRIVIDYMGLNFKREDES